MDKVVLIGNGFDLAHGLKTRYSDFLLWHINKVINERQEFPNRNITDKLISIKEEGYRVPPLNSLDELKRRKEIIPLGGFFREILSQYEYSNWVDIEYLFYTELIRIYRLFEKYNTERNEGYESRISELNRSFEYLKNSLVEYLKQLDYKEIKARDQIIEHIKNEQEFVDNTDKRANRIIYLVFNYTKTLDLYRNYIDPEHDKIIYIHGELENKSNPIIFGYGDEMDMYYEMIERLNLNEFIKNFKSFQYLKTNNYKNFFNLISGPFETIIMGHSCGISDRVLLTEIFKPSNSRIIKIFYHKRDNNTTDFEEKTQEISRHFSSDIKHTMRLRIVNHGPLLG